MQVVPCQLCHIDDVSALKLSTYPKNLEKHKSRQKIWKIFKKMEKKYTDGLPLIDPIEDMKITTKEFKKLYKTRKKKKKEILEYTRKYPTCNMHYKDYLQREKIITTKKFLQSQLQELEKNKVIEKSYVV
eukprot:UN25481